MTPTFEVLRRTGPTATPTDTVVPNGTLSALNCSDQGGALVTCVRRPTTGSNFTFWASFYVRVTSWGTATQITGINVWSDGTNNLGPGISVTIYDAGNYVQATGTVSITGDQANVANHPGISAGSNFFAWTSGTPYTIGTSVFTTTTAAPFTLPAHFILQASVGTTANIGTTPQEQVCVSIDWA